MGKRTTGIIIIVVIVVASVLLYFIVRATISSTEIFVDSYPKECNVYLNGELKGDTPISLRGLDYGEYLIEVSKEGFTTSTQSLTLNRENPKKVIFVTLEHLTFTLEVESYPSEAEVYIDGIKIGITPLKTEDLLLGKHFIEVRKQNYTKWTKEIEVKENQTIKFFAELLPSSSSISIVSVPDAAKVFINNVEKGVTPLTIENLEPGEYELLVIKDGYVPYRESFTISKGDTIKRDLVLKKATTYLIINSVPEGATLYLNNELKGKTPYEELDLKPGIYSLRLTMDGYLEFSTEIEIVTGKISKFEFTLLKFP